MGRGKSEDMDKAQQESFGEKVARVIRTVATGSTKPEEVTGSGGARKAAEEIKSRSSKVDQAIKDSGG